MKLTFEDLKGLPHSLNTYIVVKNYLDETNDYNAYVYIIPGVYDIHGIVVIFYSMF